MTELAMFELDEAELRTWFGFGVAGNFAGHLEQAGEAADFVNVVSDDGTDSAPKGIFPWYAPGYDGFLGEFPLSHDSILLPVATLDPGTIEPTAFSRFVDSGGAARARVGTTCAPGRARAWCGHTFHAGRCRS